MLGQKNRWMTDRALGAPRGTARGAGLRARAGARTGVAWLVMHSLYWRIFFADFFDADVLPAKSALKLISTTDSFRSDRRG
jgi:hypothetical protein